MSGIQAHLKKLIVCESSAVPHPASVSGERTRPRVPRWAPPPAASGVIYKSKALTEANVQILHVSVIPANWRDLLTPNVAGEGAGHCTRGRVRSPDQRHAPPVKISPLSVGSCIVPAEGEGPRNGANIAEIFKGVCGIQSQLQILNFRFSILNFPPEREDSF